MKLLKSVGVILCSISIMMVFFGFNASYGLQGIGSPSKGLTQNPEKFIDDKQITGNPIKAGADSTIGKSSIKGKIEGLFETSGTNYESTLSQGMQRIQNFTNWALGLLALICVIYLVYNGVLMLININDDKAMAKPLESIKTIAWVIGGIGLSWALVSLGFYAVKLLT